ncbi:protein DpdG [Calothrix sp. UHCC 0171]|uniref:protein DpdG n=1 Tax=Calothrix sp. UHCC 0171 TaxID=3110245 RepID=UPI002B208121|nr:protein DpdG [Calothrix sp. UHCC 0171]MEA5572614.1 protein DpdG [Calothrix sp. UHCC 0171]
MSVLKTGLAHPSRMRGIFRYLLHAEGQREKRDVLERILSPDKLVEHLAIEEKSKDKKPSHPMFNDAIRESIKCKLLIEENEEVTINQNLPKDAINPQLGDKLLPDTFTYLFLNCDNEDEADFGRICAWYLAQDIYDAPGTWEEVEKRISEQKVGDFLKMSSSRLFVQMDDWMRYLGFAWGHTLGGKTVTVPDPTAYIKRNLKHLFNGQKEITIQDFINRLAKQCPLFETGKFREEVETQIGTRETNFLSTSTAFALFRLHDEGDIQLYRQSDLAFMILPKVNNQVDNDGRISHIIWKGEKS